MENKYYYKRKLSPSERKEIAQAFGWRDVDGVRDNILGYRPLYYDSGEHYGWLVDQHVPEYDTDTLFFVRTNKENNTQLNMALDRIQDLMMEDDGYSRKEARKFLEKFGRAYYL